MTLLRLESFEFSVAAGLLALAQVGIVMFSLSLWTRMSLQASLRLVIVESNIAM